MYRAKYPVDNPSDYWKIYIQSLLGSFMHIQTTQTCASRLGYDNW